MPRPLRAGRPASPSRLHAMALVCAGLWVGAPAAADPTPPAGPVAVSWDGELRWQHSQPGISPRGPLAQAQALNPALENGSPSTQLAEVEVRGRWRQWAANLQLNHNQRSDGQTQTDARFNELHASADLDAWQLSLGKKIVSWDVGYAFRPNDVVQQEQRRSLLASTPEGRPLLQVEWFNAEQSASLVWVNPRRPEAADRLAHPTGEESALAARVYSRLGGLDAHGFARVGHDTGTSLGAAFSWVADEALELHGSARASAGHTGWQLGPAGGATDPASATLWAADPWAWARQGRAQQWLIGGQWTGSQQQSLMLEAWHDGTAPTDAHWRHWGTRNSALAALSTQLPAAAVAGNLAWQTRPLDTSRTGSSLRQDNVYARLNWQPGAGPGAGLGWGGSWQYTLDTLWHPADGGWLSSASVQWQGDRWRANAVWRQTGGPAHAVMAQLPTRRWWVLSATLAF